VQVELKCLLMLELIFNLFVGVGKGLAGVVTKPTSGVLDLASQTLKGELMRCSIL
jgi:hypothetical protein